MTWTPWMPIYGHLLGGPAPKAEFSPEFTRYHEVWAQPRWRYNVERGYIQASGLIKNGVPVEGRPPAVHFYLSPDLLPRPTHPNMTYSMSSYGGNSNQQQRIDWYPGSGDIHSSLIPEVIPSTVGAGNWFWLSPNRLSCADDPTFSPWQNVGDNHPNSAVHVNFFPGWTNYDPGWQPCQWRTDHQMNRWQFRGLIKYSGTLGQTPPFDNVLHVVTPSVLPGNVLNAVMGYFGWAGGNAASLRCDAGPVADGHYIRLVSAKANPVLWLWLGLDYYLRRP